MLRGKAILLLCLIGLLWSCDKEENPNRLLWGETQCYDDFLFCDYEPVLMTQTLVFDFNEDAKRLIKREIVFELVVKSDEDTFKETDEVILHKNGMLCPDNLLRINSSDKEVELGVEFTEGAEEGNHTMFLKVLDDAGLDRIDDIDLSVNRNKVLAHEWIVKKDEVFNPLAVGVFWTGLILVSFLILWRLMLRFMFYDTFKKRAALYIYSSNSAMKTVRIKGAHKIVCTSKSKRQSLASQFFKGKIFYVQNVFWQKDAEISPRSRNRIKINVDRGYSISPRSVIGLETEVEIANRNKEIIKIKLSKI